MERDLSPEALLALVEKGSMGPVYIFHGPDEFTMELVLAKVKEGLVPEAARDFNCRTFYCDDEPDRVVCHVMESARSVPFLSERRLLILRRLERLSSEQLDVLASYAKAPSDTSCLICISGRPDFRVGFYRTVRSMEGCVHFPELREKQLLSWIRKRAAEMGLTIEEEACRFFLQYVGNRLSDIYSELEKLFLRHGPSKVGEDEIRELALQNRIFTVFELMDAFSERDCAKALSILERYVEEEGGTKGWDLRLMGMFIRQITLLIRIKELLRSGLNVSQAAGRLKILPFLAPKLADQSERWSFEDLRCAVEQLYEADGMLKQSTPSPLVMDYVVLSLCRRN
jgi:DNA polymerase-3 subunit delta